MDFRHKLVLFYPDLAILTAYFYFVKNTFFIHAYQQKNSDQAAFHHRPREQPYCPPA